MAKPQPTLSLIVPAFNESASIAGTLAAIRRYLASQPWEWEVIVAADGTDGTRECAAEFAKQDPRFGVMGSPRRLGKGRGVREAMLRASGSIVGFLDADYKTPIEEFDKILPWFARGYQVVIGSRRVGDAQVEVAAPLHRRVGSRVFNALMRSAMGLPDVRDTQCGFKFFTRNAARWLFSLQRIDGYMFDVEVLRLCKLLSLRVKEVGVRWRDDNDSRYDPVFGTLKNLGELLHIRGLGYDLSESALLAAKVAGNAAPQISAKKSAA